jgi:hypothetical protein
MSDDQGKNNPGTGASSGSDDQAKVPVKPAALADSDLEKVAGGSFRASATNLDTTSKIAPSKFSP